ASTRLITDPPITLGAPLVRAPGSSLKARILLTFSSNGLLSVVPRKWLAGVAPLLPVSFQKLDDEMPPRVAALTLVNGAPLPAKEPVKRLVPLKKFTGLRYVPAIPAFGTTPVKLLAVMA